MQYIGFWRRFAAAFIDAIILGVIGSILASVLGMGSMNGQVNWGSNLISLLLAIGYYGYYQNKTGQTLGKKVLGIKVVNAQGKTPSIGTLLLRDIIGKFVSAIILFIGYLMVIWDPKKQALHDKIAGTFVVKA